MNYFDSTEIFFCYFCAFYAIKSPIPANIIPFIDFINNGVLYFIYYKKNLQKYNLINFFESVLTCNTILYNRKLYCHMEFFDFSLKCSFYNIYINIFYSSNNKLILFYFMII
jgi:hypothetical protein